MVVVVLAGAVVILIGIGLIWMWQKERSDRTVYERNLSAFSQFVAPEFARGFAGAQIVLSCGLIVMGLLCVIVGPVVDRPDAEAPIPFVVVQAMFAFAMSSFVATILITWLGRPKFLFPAHARDDFVPVKVWWARKRNGTSQVYKQR